MVLCQGTDNDKLTQLGENNDKNKVYTHNLEGFWTKQHINLGINRGNQVYPPNLEGFCAKTTHK